jgi:hypothetical protein
VNPLSLSALRAFTSHDAGAVNEVSYQEVEGSSTIPWFINPYKIGKRAGEGIMGTPPSGPPDDSASNVKFWIGVGLVVLVAAGAYLYLRKGGSGGGAGQMVIVR